MLTESQQQRTLRASVIDRFTLVATQPDQDTKFPVGPESAKKLGRGLWYKVQPYLIGLFTAKGIPMLWQGEEFGENYWVPPGGLGRVMLLRPVRWDYFYGDVGRSTVGLVRRLISLRRQTPELRNGDHFFYNDWALPVARSLALLALEGGPIHAGGAELQRGRSDRVVLVPHERRLPRADSWERERSAHERGREHRDFSPHTEQLRSGLAEVLKT